jgi:hypothetical protein
MTPVVDFERRMRRVSDLRALVLSLKRAALDQYRQGRISFKPQLDILSDCEYWRRLAELESAFSRKPHAAEPPI